MGKFVFHILNNWVLSLPELRESNLRLIKFKDIGGGFGAIEFYIYISR